MSRARLFKGPKKGNSRFVVKCKWNDKERMCNECYTNLLEYCESEGLAELPELWMKEFYIPADWFHASQRLGCPHENDRPLVVTDRPISMIREPIVVSAYV